jgi:hypothetical protein
MHRFRCAKGFFLSASNRNTPLLLLQLRPRIRLNLWLVSGGGSIPFQALRHDDALVYPFGLRGTFSRFDLPGPFCDKAHSVWLGSSTEQFSLC